MGIEGKVSIPTVQYILIVNIKKKIRRLKSSANGNTGGDSKYSMLIPKCLRSKVTSVGKLS